MSNRIGISGSSWRKKLSCFALLSFLGLYGLGLLPHHHALNAADDPDCVVCHAVSGLGHLTGDASPPDTRLADYILQILLVLPWVPAALARTDKLLFFKQSRAPPSVS